MVEAAQEVAVLHARLLLDLTAQAPAVGVPTVPADDHDQRDQEDDDQDLADDQRGRRRDAQAQIAPQQVRHGGQHHRDAQEENPSHQGGAQQPVLIGGRPALAGPGHAWTSARKRYPTEGTVSM